MGRAVALLGAWVLLCAVSAVAASLPLQELQKGDAVQDIAFVGLTADSAALSSFAGEKGLIVIYWSTSSAASPEMLQFAEKELRRYAEHGMNLLAVDAEAPEMRIEDLSAVRAQAAKMGLSFPVVLDAARKGFDGAGIEHVPTVLVLDKDLRIVDAFSGVSPAVRAAIVESVDSFLGFGVEAAREKTDALPAPRPNSEGAVETPSPAPPGPSPALPVEAPPAAGGPSSVPAVGTPSLDGGADGGS